MTKVICYTKDRLYIAITKSTINIHYKSSNEIKMNNTMFEYQRAGYPAQLKLKASENE